MRLILPIVFMVMYAGIAYYFSDIVGKQTTMYHAMFMYVALLLSLLLTSPLYKNRIKHHTLSLNDDLVLDTTTIVPAGTQFKAQQVEFGKGVHYSTTYNLINGKTVKIQIGDDIGFFIDMPNKLVWLPLSVFTIEEE